MTRLRLYVTGHTVGAERARCALRDIERRLVAQSGEASVFAEVIDVLDDPESAGQDQIFATPTVIRLGPGPQVRLFGDLSSADKLMRGLKLDDTREIRLAETA
jgi:circadian clock protein KaiB